MVEIKEVIILLTPFHKKALYHLFPEKFNQRTTLILHSLIVNVAEFNCCKEQLTPYDFSRKKIFQSPLKLIRPIKKKVEQIKNEIAELHHNYNFSGPLCFIIGSDKDIFTQFLLYNLGKSTKKIIAVDEGLGFYVRRTLKDFVIALLYQLFTPILFGQRLYYIKRLGTMPGISEVYLRDIGLLPKQQKHIKYKEFHFNELQVPKIINSGKVLLYSFPNQDYLFEEVEKIDIYRKIGSYLKANSRELIIKPHPREDYNGLVLGLSEYENINVLNGSFLGETLNYFEYEYIINVFSSIILDIVSSSYPKKRLLTLGFTKRPLIRFDKQLFYIPIKEFNIENEIKFEN
jgi:hypothetical protein